MVVLGILTLIYGAVYVIEVFYDFDRKQDEIILSKLDDDRLTKRKKWHKLNWWMHFLAVIPVSFFLFWFGLDIRYLVAPFFLGSLRVLVLNLGMNILEKKVKLLHLSSEGVEGKFKGLEWLYYIMILLVFLGGGAIILTI